MVLVICSTINNDGTAHWLHLVAKLQTSEEIVNNQIIPIFLPSLDLHNWFQQCLCDQQNFIAI